MRRRGITRRCGGPSRRVSFSWFESRRGAGPAAQRPHVMCRRRIIGLLPLVALILAGCCIEGHPVIRERDVALNEVPARVRSAFERGYNTDEILRVEHTWMNSVCAEDVRRYRFHLRDGHTVTLDDKGELAPWVPGLRDDSPRPGGT